jgi:putative CocE/NonD family hydrolase
MRPILTFRLPVLHAILAAGALHGARLVSQGTDSSFVRDNFTKYEHRIPMRDGIQLFTIVYVPKDASAATTYPILMDRTCYSIAPYGLDSYARSIGPNPFVMREKYIFVAQDVRGRYMSEGTFANARPFIPDSVKARDAKATDEASDTYDTIDWLVKNIPFNNGKVGQYGISYPGFYASMGALSRHPALVVSSPQAPVTDFFFEDFHHNGALTQAYFYAYPIFGIPSGGPTTKDWWEPKMLLDVGLPDDYAFQLSLGSLKHTTERFYNDNLFWQEIIHHPNYDSYWSARAVPPDLRGVKHAVMAVGGWFDAEDLYGPLTVYKTLKKYDPDAKATLVYGPFRHGGWEERGIVHTFHGDIYFGDSVQTKFQRDVEAPYFRHYLKGPGDGQTGLPEAYMFNTGRKDWESFSRWPAPNAQTASYYFHADGSLSTDPPTAAHASLAYPSDPQKPVPSRCLGPTIQGFSLYKYMSDDQRCNRSRIDVLTFQTPELDHDITLGGEITARLNVSTTGTDADYVVKLIDVYPMNEPDLPFRPDTAIHMGGYEQLVRGEIMRARFRTSFAKPMPMQPNAVTSVTFRLQDVLHTFKKGHRIMVQVQSSWFPAFDRNPQHYVPNIFEANDSDFVKATEFVWVDHQNPSRLEVQVLP